MEDEGRPTLPYRLAKLQTLFTETKQRQYFEAHPPRSIFTLTLDADAAPGRHEGEGKCNAPGSERAGESTGGSRSGASGPQWETVMGRYRAAQRFHKTGRYAAMEEEAAHISEITPWLKSTGFAAHLAGVEVAGLPSSYCLPDLFTSGFACRPALRFGGVQAPGYAYSVSDNYIWIYAVYACRVM